MKAGGHMTRGKATVTGDQEQQPAAAAKPCQAQGHRAAIRVIIVAQQNAGAARQARRCGDRVALAMAVGN